MTTLIQRLPGRLEPALDRVLRQLLLARLAGLEHGRVIIEDALGRHELGRSAPDQGEPLDATITVHDARAYRRVALGGSVGAAEGYIDGFWTSDDLVSLLRIFARSMDAANALDQGPSWLPRLRYRWQHRQRKNTRPGSRRNIHAHYDLGNELFALFLDDTMTYSCGIFESPHATMREASIAKLDRICQKLELGPGDRVLEIGTGWGSFAIHAATRYGCHVTTTTISARQHALATERVRALGLDDRITLLLRDYRDLDGTYDKLVSIEMIEAVGHDYLDAFFGLCCQRLRPQGLMLLQAITMRDQRYDQARRDVDFIRQYIFPGSVIPSITAMLDSLTRATDMRLVHLEDITPHYARTLAAWRARFHEHGDEVRALGYDEPFIRLWDYYLALCQAGFAERYTGNVQMLLCRPWNRRAPILPRLGST